MTKRNVRKMGIDVPHRFMWAAFAFVVIAAAVASYIAIETDNRKEEFGLMARNASVEIRSIAREYGSIYNVPSPQTFLKDKNIFPPSYIRDDGTIKIPDGLDLIFGIIDASTVSLTVRGPDTYLGRNVCEYLRAGAETNRQISSGPMGTSYVLRIAQCESGFGSVALQATYAIAGS